MAHRITSPSANIEQIVHFETAGPGDTDDPALCEPEVGNCSRVAENGQGDLPGEKVHGLVWQLYRN